MRRFLINSSGIEVRQRRGGFSPEEGQQIYIIEGYMTHCLTSQPAARESLLQGGCWI